jgi:hypothetical protein
MKVEKYLCDICQMETLQAEMQSGPDGAPYRRTKSRWRRETTDNNVRVSVLAETPSGQAMDLCENCWSNLIAPLLPNLFPELTCK